MGNMGKAQATFKVVKGFSGDDTIALQLLTNPNAYLVNWHHVARETHYSGSKDWRLRASWKLRTAISADKNLPPGGMSFESVRQPGYYLYLHSNNHLYIYRRAVHHTKDDAVWTKRATWFANDGLFDADRKCPDECGREGHCSFKRGRCEQGCLWSTYGPKCSQSLAMTLSLSNPKQKVEGDVLRSKPTQNYHVRFFNKEVAKDTSIRRAEGTFRVVPGLFDMSEGYSLEMISSPGMYLVAAGSVARVQKNTNDDGFRKTATFRLRSALDSSLAKGHVSFESYSRKDHYLYLHPNQHAYFHRPNTGDKEWNSRASWKVQGPAFDMSETCPNNCGEGKTHQKCSFEEAKCVADVLGKVAFWPGKVNQHIEGGKWVSDKDGIAGAITGPQKSCGSKLERNVKTDCPSEVLLYCKRFYPKANRVVESGTKEKVAAFCEQGNKNCKHSTDRNPFLCLA